MITDFKENETRKSGLVYNGTWEQIKMLYAQDPEKAGELAISAIELTLTGQISSDDFMIQLALKNTEKIVEENKKSYEKKLVTQKQRKIEEYKLAEIAELYLQGLKQQAIGDKLNLSQQLVSYRIGIIKNDYPELLKVDEYKNTKNTKNTAYDNDNDNDNVNDKKSKICSNEQVLQESCSDEQNSFGAFSF